MIFRYQQQDENILYMIAHTIRMRPTAINIQVFMHVKH
jgi:hypothetical protein